MNRPFASTALMFGNFVTGMALLGPTALLGELSAGLGVSIRAASLLITFGSIVVCIGSPVTAWLTSRVDRRQLLTVTVGIIAAANIASALAPDFASLLAVRFVLAAVAALYTPQAAGTVALIVPPEKRGSSIAYVFLGWTLVAAVGLPVLTFIGSRYGWRVAYGFIGGMNGLSAVLLAWRLPRGLFGAAVDLRTWTALARNPLVVVLLLITTLQISGQFVIFTFMAPLLARLAAAGPDTIVLVFAAYGLCALTGIVIATRVVDRWGGFRTSATFTTLVLAGMSIWALGAGTLPLMVLGVAVWGLGFGAINSMQQVRLVGAAPALATASVSLNTSVLYIGQAIGSGIGGVLFADDRLHASGYVAAGFVALALVMVMSTRGR